VVRTWLGQALRASGVAILVPLAIVAAIALSVVGGGGNARSLGQVLNGPAVPPAEAAQPPVAHTRRGLTFRGLSPQRHLTLRGLSPQRHVTQRGLSPRRHAPVTTVPDRPGPSAPPASPAPPAAPAPSPSPPPAAPAPHPIHDTGTQVAETVRPLPVAGPVAADAVQAVVDLVDPPA
jgi:hypothetical protein